MKYAIYISIWVALLVAVVMAFLPLFSMAAQPDVCTFAELRLKEVQTDWSHAGFYRMAAPLQKATSTKGTWRENLARNFNDEASVYEAWKRSPSHNANLVATSSASCLRHANGYWVLITWSPLRTIKKH